MSDASSDDKQADIVLSLESDGDEVTLETDGSAEANELLEALLEAQEARESEEREAAERQEAERIDGVVIGRLLALGDGGPKVSYPGCPVTNGLVARAAAQLTDEDVGRRVALVFEGGNPALPMLIGPIHNDRDPDEGEVEHPALEGLLIREDDDRIDIRCRKAIGLNVGKASIIITPAGKILVRGKHLLSRASSVNRIRGAAVKIN